MKRPTFTLSEIEFKYFLEALKIELDMWLYLNHTTTNEDLQSDLANDSMVLEGYIQYLEKNPIIAFTESPLPISKDIVFALQAIDHAIEKAKKTNDTDALGPLQQTSAILIHVGCEEYSEIILKFVHSDCNAPYLDCGTSHQKCILPHLTCGLPYFFYQ